MLAPKKQIDKSQSVYHLFKLSPTFYILYDNDMDLPLQYGALNVVDPKIKAVREQVKGAFIHYYDRDVSKGYSFKRNEMKTRVNNTPDDTK